MIPYAVSWNITNKCNLKCKQCNLEFNNEIYNELSYDECLKVIDDLAENKVFLISFTGGEPLVRKDLKDLISYAHSKRITTCIATNGLLLDDDFLKHIKSNGTTAIGISLDSFIRDKNDSIRGFKTYDRIINAIKIAINYGINVIISVVINRNNIKELPDFLSSAYSLGCKRVKVQVEIQKNKGKYNLSLNSDELEYVGKVCGEFCNTISNDDYIVFCCYTNYLKGYFRSGITSSNCNAGFKRINILANGDLRICELLEESVIGNLKNEKFKNIWNNSALVKKWNEVHVLGEKCIGCNQSNICKGGCPIFSTNKSSMRFYNDINCKINSIGY